MVSDSFDKWVLTHMCEELTAVIDSDSNSEMPQTKGDITNIADAIRKFTFFGWNYAIIHHEWGDDSEKIMADELPEFLVKAKWTCNFDHMLKKWKSVTLNGDSNSYLPLFFRELDNENRRILVEWILSNYQG